MSCAPLSEPKVPFFAQILDSVSESTGVCDCPDFAAARASASMSDIAPSLRPKKRSIFLPPATI